MFDLNKALAAWRRGFQYQRVVFREDLDELECHLRDHIDALLASGYTEEKAFRAAMQDVGDARHTQAEYRKVFWPKLKHRRGRPASRLSKPKNANGSTPTPSS